MYMFSNQAFSHFYSPTQYPPPQNSVSMTLYCVTNKRLPAALADIFFFLFNRLAAIRCNISVHYKPSNTSKMTTPSKKMQSWWNAPKVDQRFVFNHWIYTSTVPRWTSDVRYKLMRRTSWESRLNGLWTCLLSILSGKKHFKMLFLCD